MAELFIGELLQIAGTFAPEGTVLCDGQLLSINDHTALYSLIGTNFGGDGINDFAVPDLRGRVAIGAGQAYPGAVIIPKYSKGGFGEAVLSEANLPPHTHGVSMTYDAYIEASTADATDGGGGQFDSGEFVAKPVSPSPYENNEYEFFTTSTANPVILGGSTMTVKSSVVHDTGSSNASLPMYQPFATLNWVISTQGVYPSRS